MQLSASIWEDNSNVKRTEFVTVPAQTSVMAMSRTTWPVVSMAMAKLSLFSELSVHPPTCLALSTLDFIIFCCGENFDTILSFL